MDSDSDYTKIKEEYKSSLDSKLYKQNFVRDNEKANFHSEDKQYWQFEDNCFPFVEDESMGPIIEESVYVQIRDEINKRQEWTLRFEYDQLALSYIRDPTNKIIISWKNLLGASYEPIQQDKGEPIFEFKLHLMKIMEKSCFIKRDRVCSDLCFVVESELRAQYLTVLVQNYARNETYMQSICEDLRAQRLPIFRHRLLVFINPIGGQGKASDKWQSVERLFKLGGYEYLIVETKFKDHAKQYIRDIPKEDLLQYRGIITVSGDGLPHEVLNGILGRSDSQEILQHITLGVLQGGSGNGLISSILTNCQEPLSLNSAAYLICKGCIKKMDLVHIQTRSDPNIYSFLSLCWGFMADVDINSEHLRSFGRFRFDLYGSFRAIFQKNYQGIISFTEEQIDELPLLSTPTDQLLNGWQQEQCRQFKLLTLMNVPMITSEDLNAPNAKINDGYIDLQLLNSNQGWLKLIKYSLQFQSGGHFDKNTNLPVNGINFLYRKVKAFRLESLNQENLGVVSIDGENYQSDIIQGRIMPQILRVFSF